MSIDAMQKVVADYFAATRSMDVEAWLATFAPDAVSYEPGSPPLTNREARYQFFQGIATQFETVGLTEDFISFVGNEVAVKWTGRGLGKNGRAVKFEGIDLFEFNAAGQIQTLRVYWDPAAVLAELQLQPQGV
jgi:steroid Delta-isomerase